MHQRININYKRIYVQIFGYHLHFNYNFPISSFTKGNVFSSKYYYHGSVVQFLRLLQFRIISQNISFYLFVFYAFIPNFERNALHCNLQHLKF